MKLEEALDVIGLLLSENLDKRRMDYTGSKILESYAIKHLRCRIPTEEHNTNTGVNYRRAKNDIFFTRFEWMPSKYIELFRLSNCGFVLPFL